MLFRRRVITPTTTEREVVVVRAKRPAGLYAALGVATICAVGLIGYLTYAIYDEGQNEQPVVAATVTPRTDGRAQALAKPERTNRPATTIIVNPPPIVHVTPSAPAPPAAKPPERTVIVQGATREEQEAEERARRASEDLKNQTSTGEEKTSSSGEDEL